jgi:hypothetical protein
MLEECEICGQSTGKLYVCKACSAKFCRYCGSFTEKLCIDCFESEDEEEAQTGEELKPQPKASTR